MSLLLAPYTNAMRLGQGFNSYTQQICVDDAVIVDPNRAENILTNDGTTMRIVAETSGKPSAWNRLKEVVDPGPTKSTDSLEPSPDSTPAGLIEGVAKPDDVSAGHSDTVAATDPDVNASPDADAHGDAHVQSDTTATAHEDTAADHDTDANADAAAAANADDKNGAEAATDETAHTAGASDSSDVGSVVKVSEEDTHPDPAPETPEADTSHTAPKSATSELVAKYETRAAKTSATTTSPNSKTAGTKPRSSSVGHKQSTSKTSVEPKKGSAKFQVKEIPTRERKDAAPPTPKPAPKKPLTELEIEQARLEKQEQLEMMREEKARMKEQRDYQKQLELEARQDERQRQQDERAEQAQIRAEKRKYDQARREAAQKAMSEAIAAKKDALTLEDLNKIKAQNQFADRFDGIFNSDRAYPFDPTAPRGPSQTVTYSSRFIDKLSDVTDDMCISGALSVKMAKIGGSGRGSFVDSDKFKQSDLNFYISVKVINQTINFKDALVYNSMRSCEPGSDEWKKVYGDSFISGFVEGGEFNALVSMKVHNKAKLLDIKAEAKVALTTGPVDITAEANVGIARTNLEMNTETTIQVSWCGGGHIKHMEQPWNIQSIMEAAARFPSLVANCPQRTHAILTKYESLRSFVSLRPAAYSPIQYENAQIYTNVLMDAFMSYKSLYKKLGDQATGFQNKTLEFEPWPSSDGTDGSRPASSSTPASSTAHTAIGQAIASGDARALAAAKSYAAALAAAVDTTPFQASLQGLSDARKFIRRQMVYIVNEIDLIEKDPKVATDEEHEEPFQSPTLFETRLPNMKIPDRLKPKSDPLTGKRIMAKTQTEQELLDEQKEQDQLQNESPALYQMDQDLYPDETASLDDVRKKVPKIGKHLQVSTAAPKTDKGALFNNLDFLLPEWQVESISIGITKRGCVGAVEVVYENGLILRKGLAAENLVRKTLGNFQAGERIFAVAIEHGVATGTQDPRVLSVCMYTNRGRRLLGQAVKNDIMPGGKVSKDSVVYENIHTVYLDNAFSTGTLKGFFGRLDTNETNGGILRLGLIWGDSTSTKLSNTVAEPAPVYDTDTNTNNATINAFREERDQARRETEQAKAQAKTEIEKAKQDVDSRINQATEKAKQIKFANGVSTGRQSVSFKGDTFKVSPNDKPFLVFENGNQFCYQRDGNLVVYDANQRVQWAFGKYGEGAGDLIFHGGNDGNLVAWKNGGATWATETKNARNGTLVLSSERPFLEIFTEDGRRQCHYPS
ncbi:hypothetical protein A1O7_08832 [Cladophialophora yegresii CBS 114405]|uniref:Bulb-type lectin domain-containing protein n=1 Tax=Cladophialophora yegresii CBS 114405 TaxID=1182544 RepID=W9VUT5_9EURO|nr:uncharacterized protein A1O7_08832 [Cladophialophora yegresii CBS 114405]EXJ55901.1 hypothetical protein A1O7_08832 [Cladophialophora yegresii CBS 114405]